MNKEMELPQFEIVAAYAGGQGIATAIHSVSLQEASALIFNAMRDDKKLDLLDVKGGSVLIDAGKIIFCTVKPISIIAPVKLAIDASGKIKDKDVH